RLAHTEWTDFKFQSEMFEYLIQAPPFTLQYDHADRCQRWKERLAAAEARLKAGGMEKVAVVFQAATHAARDDWMIQRNFGRFLTDTTLYPEAERRYRRVLESMRHNWDAHLMIGRLNVMMKKPDVAVAQFR